MSAVYDHRLGRFRCSLAFVCDTGESTGSYVVDAAPLGKAERLSNGMLRAPATLTRAGVFVYRLPDGRTRRELRPPEEVFAEDSLATLELAPLTLEHPEPIGTPVTADNARTLQVGHVGDSLERAGDMLRAKVMVTDAEAVRQVEAGERREVSLGYWRELDPTPGVWRGIPYDAVQRNIRYNHAAITKRGRAGPDVRIRLDSETAVLVGDAADDPPPPHREHEEHGMKFKITIDGITHEIECSESTGATIQKALGDRDRKIEALDSQISEARKLVDQAKAEADAAKAEAKKLQEQVTDSVSPERVAELVEARLDLEREAEPLLNADKDDADRVDVAELSDQEIRKRVILLTDAGADLEEASDEYIRARYDAAVSFLTADAREAARQSRRAVRKASGAPPARKPSKADAARQRMIADTHNAWKKDLPDYEDESGKQA